MTRLLVTGPGRTIWSGLGRSVSAPHGPDSARNRPIRDDRSPRSAPRSAYSLLGNGRRAATRVPPPAGSLTTLAAAFASAAPPAPWKVA